MLLVLCGTRNEGGVREGEGMVRTDAFEDEVWPLIDGLVGEGWHLGMFIRDPSNRRKKRTGDGKGMDADMWKTPLDPSEHAP